MLGDLVGCGRRRVGVERDSNPRTLSAKSLVSVTADVAVTWRLGSFMEFCWL